MEKYKVILIVDIAQDKVYNITREINFVVETLNDAHQEKMHINIEKIQAIKTASK